MMSWTDWLDWAGRLSRGEDSVAGARLLVIGVGEIGEEVEVKTSAEGGEFCFLPNEKRLKAIF